MCVNNLAKVALDSAATAIEPAISSRKSNALTTTSRSHRKQLRCQRTDKRRTYIKGRVSCTGNRTPIARIVHRQPAIHNKLRVSERLSDYYYYYYYILQVEFGLYRRTCADFW